MKAFLTCLAAFVLSASGAAAEESVFPIGGYSGSPARDKAAGFSIAGAIYGDQSKFLAECEAEQFPCVYSIGAPIDFLGRKGERVRAIDPEEVREEIARQVKAVAHSSVIVAWRIVPSELRHWYPAEMEYLKVASEAIQATDPLKRPAYLYEPGHRSRSALEKTLPFQQISTKGIYTNLYKRRSQRAWVPWTVREQLKAIESANPKAIPYAMLEMYKLPRDDFPLEEIPVWVRHDAYASLVGGVRGILIYSFGRRPGFSEGTPEWNAYYQAWAGVARELNGPSQLGIMFLNGKPAATPGFEIVSGSGLAVLPGSKVQPPEDQEVPSLNGVSLDWGGRKYWIIVNSSEAPVTIRLHDEKANWEPLLTGQPVISTRCEIELKGLAVAAFRRQE